MQMLDAFAAFRDWLAVSVMVLVDSLNDPLDTVGSSSTVAETALECGPTPTIFTATEYQYFVPTVGLVCVHEVVEALEIETVLLLDEPSCQYFS